MSLIISFPSAYEFWMHQPANNGYPVLSPNTDLLPNENDLSANKSILVLSSPLHVALPKKRKPIHTPEIISHELPAKYPAGSFKQIAEDLFISSPEMCFLQAAAHMPLALLIEIANDLCGAYYLDPCSKYGQKKRAPLTTITEIKAFLDKAKGLYGVNKARYALRFAADNSFSPYESRIASNGVLSMHFGGYSVPKPELNFKIQLTPDAKKILGNDECTCDMVWPENRLVFEYDSNTSHLETNQHYTDKKRQNAITLSGYQLITATYADFQSFQNTEKTYLLIRKALGLRTQRCRLEKNIEERWKVYQQLFRRKW